MDVSLAHQLDSKKARANLEEPSQALAILTRADKNMKNKCQQTNCVYIYQQIYYRFAVN